MASKRRNGFITADKNDIKKTKKESNEVNCLFVNFLTNQNSRNFFNTKNRF